MTPDSRQPPNREFVNSKARFITELAPRITALRQGLTRVGATDHDQDEVNAVKRRIHALAAAAQVLDFTSASDALAQAEAALVAAGSAPMAPLAVERVTRILDALPTLVLGGSVPLTQELDSELNRPLRPPFTLIVFGSPALAQGLQGAGPLQEADYHETDNPTELLSVQQTLGPDAILLDGDLCADGLLVEQVTQASGAASLPVVVVCSFEDPDLPQRLLRAGASRVLPKPVEPWVLQRTLRQACVSRVLPSTQYSSFERLTPYELVAAIASEARRALVDAIDPALQHQPLNFESGAPVLGSLWTALARIRSLSTEAAQELHFAPTGPSGSIPLSPSDGQAPRSTHRSCATTVPLKGRSLLLVHPDPNIRAALRQVVQDLRLRVTEAATSEEAQTHARSQWPHAIVCGPQSPGFEGLELAHAIEHDIALADVPVLLLTDPLHVPLARAPSIAPFLGEALGQRFLLEERLQRLSDVHGRLDGVTPRLLLELASLYQPNCNLALRSGSLRFEVTLQQGQITLATMHRDAREVGRGQDVFGPLLGTRTGRYRIVQIEQVGGVPVRLAGSLRETLEPAIERARLARKCLSPSALLGVERMVLEPSVVSQYLTECPRPVRAILTQLTDGAAPHRLLHNAESIADTTRLHTTLEELCRRGALVAILDPQGEDLLASREAAPLPLVNLAPVSEAPATPPLPSAETLRPYATPPVVERVQTSPFNLADAVLESVVHEPEAELERDRPSTPLPAPPEPEAELSAHAQAARSAWRSAPAEATASDDASETTRPRPQTVKSRALSVLLPTAIASVSALGVVLISRFLIPTEWTASERAPEVIVPPVVQAAPAPSPTEASPPVLSKSEVSFELEELPLPKSAHLLPNHGLLEIHTWTSQRLSVDGVFIGNYQNRRVPLKPGNYTLQLGRPATGWSHLVTVVAGRRLRIIARRRAAP